MTICFTNNETKLLKILIKSNNFLNVNSLSKKIGFSERSIYTFVQSISNECLKLKIAPPRNVYRQGYFLPDDSKKKLESIISKNLIKEHEINKLSSSERKVLDLLLLFLDDHVTTTTFISWEKVSKNTVLTDLSQMKLDLKKYSIEVISDQNGHHLVGQELSIRNYAQLQFRQHIGLLNRFFNQIQTLDVFSELMNLSLMLNDWIKKIENRTKRIYTDNMILFFESYYAFVLYRMMNNKILKYSDFISDAAERKEMEASDEYKLIHSFIIQFGRNLVEGTDECLYLESLLLEGQRRIQSVQILGNVKKSVLNVTKEIIQNFKQLSGVHFEDETRLDKDLYIHLLATYYRVKYHHQYVDGAEQIKKDYPDIYTYTKISVYPFEKLNKEKLNTSEISLIAIYFGAQIIKEHRNEKSALIVCSSGIGTSRFLMAQLNNVFPSLKLIGPISEKEYSSMVSIDEDIVISTINLKKNDKDVIHVDSIMDESSLNELKKELAVRNIIFSKQSTDQMKSLLDVIADNTEIKNISGLIVGLKEVLTFNIDPKSKIERGYQPMLSELLNLNTITFKSAKDLKWEDAIRLAADPLLINGNISESYTDAMIESVNKNGPYINIGSNVALAHARPEAGVNNLSMSVLKLDHPIDLVDSNHKIQLIFVLAAINSTSHLKALSELASILGDKQKLRELFEARDRNEFLDVILRSEKNEISSGM